MTMFHFTIAIAMVAVAAALIVWIRGYLAQNSQRRMTGMLKRAGLDPAMAATGDQEAIMREVRHRCRRCSSEDLCERWLAGQEKGDNRFCPNVEVFEFLKRTTDPSIDAGHPAI